MFQSINSLHKCGRKCQEDSTQAEFIMDKSLSLFCSKQVDLSTTGTETQKDVRQDNGVGHRRKRAVSSTASESVRLRECSTIYHQQGTSKKSERILEKEQLSSSCDSVTLRSSLAESHVSTQILESNIPSCKENARASSSVDAEHSKMLTDPCRLNVSRR